jgi:choline dehydrogenase
MTERFGTVVVGAGSAGAVIAARVTESSAHELLLLEAGPDYPDADKWPADLRDGTQNSFHAHDWEYIHKATSQQVPWKLPRGRVVGGSSAVNTCIGLRGVPSDYDEWAARGLPEWTWEKCLPAFKRLENDLDIRNEWHGNDGPIPLRRHPRSELVPWQAGFFDAALELGFPETKDHNAPDARGVGPHAMNKIDGRRMNAALCYLTPAVRARENLTLRADNHVHRVRIEQGRVTGVEVEHKGRVRFVPADRVVLAAGAIATPGILLRSGIGKRSDLDRLGIPVVRALEGVGHQLLDHHGAAFFLRPKRGIVTMNDPLIQMALRFRSHTGEHENDLQIQAGSLIRTPWGSLPIVLLMCQVGKPKGVGTMHWGDKDPHAKPTINSLLLEHPDDRAKAVEGLHVAMELAETRPLRELGSFLYPPKFILKSKTLLDGYIRKVSDSGYHPSGTAPMGTADDRLAVTDQYGRVFGIEGLFVADASLMPTIPTANTNLPTLMMGERFGEWLRDGLPAGA